MYIHARVKGPKGSITLPVVPLRSREKSMQTAQLQKVDQEARDQYEAIYAGEEFTADQITVDIKISKSR